MTTTALHRIDPIHNAKVAAALATLQLSSLDLLREPVPYEFDPALIEHLTAHGLKTQTDEGLDQWLAPRLHCALRLPRSVAADPGIWTWLATGVMRDYITKRWKIDQTAKFPWWRYNDQGILRNGVARLWWAAELVRSGPDYSLVPDALRKVRVFQNVGELRYSWHRETARAFTRVLAEHNDVGDELSVVFNAYLATQALETFDTQPSELERTSWDPEWAKAQPTLKELLLPVQQLEGPDAGYARQPVEDALLGWLRDVMESAATTKV